MKIETVATFFSSVKSIWAGMLILITAAAWAGDTRWMTVSSYNSNQKIMIIQQINREMAELEIKLIYTEKARQKEMIQAIIINKKTQIKNIKESQ